MEKDTDISLIGYLREVPDPRASYSQKHKFLDIIVITITAVLSGMDIWNGIEDWAGSKKEWLRGIGACAASVTEKGRTPEQ